LHAKSPTFRAAKLKGFTVSWESLWTMNIPINYILPKIRFPGLHFYCR